MLPNTGLFTHFPHAGGGKTITFCALARILNCRTLILVHRDQLLDQTVKSLNRVWPGVAVGRVWGRFDEHHNK